MDRTVRSPRVAVRRGFLSCREAWDAIRCGAGRAGVMNHAITWLACWHGQVLWEKNGRGTALQGCHVASLNDTNPCLAGEEWVARTISISISAAIERCRRLIEITIR
jgi:hypothetical protein